MSQMVEVKTADLIGPALDWAVVKADGRCLHERIRIVRYNDDSDHICEDCGKDTYMEPSRYSWKPSTDWSQGGPLIEKYAVKIEHFPSETIASKANARIAMHSTAYWQSGPAPLVALCRAIVAANLGELVSVPEELVQQQGEGGGK